MRAAQYSGAGCAARPDLLLAGEGKQDLKIAHLLSIVPAHCCSLALAFSA